MNPISTIWSVFAYPVFKNVFNCEVFYWQRFRFLRLLWSDLLASCLTKWLALVPDIVQDSKQCRDGDRGPRDHGHMQGPRSSEEGVSTSSPLRQATAIRPAYNAWSDARPRQPHATCRAAQTTRPDTPTTGRAPICQSAVLHWRVRESQDPAPGQLPVHEHLGRPALPQIWRGNFPEQRRVTKISKNEKQNLSSQNVRNAL